MIGLPISRGMRKFQKWTTAIKAYSVPKWYENSIDSIYFYICARYRLQANKTATRQRKKTINKTNQNRNKSKVFHVSYKLQRSKLQLQVNKQISRVIDWIACVVLLFLVCDRIMVYCWKTVANLYNSLVGLSMPQLERCFFSIYLFKFNYQITRVLVSKAREKTTKSCLFEIVMIASHIIALTITRDARLNEKHTKKNNSE